MYKYIWMVVCVLCVFYYLKKKLPLENYHLSRTINLPSC